MSITSHYLEILYQDEALLGINKPAGLLSIADGYNKSLPHLAELLLLKFGKVWIIHRLDRETSGIILVARSREAHREMNSQFEQRMVKKTYHAIVSGNPIWEEISVDSPLRVNGDRHHRSVVAPLTGKPAVTKFKVLQRFESACLIEAQPHTGYTHQIRAHLAATGYPLLGDKLYGGEPSLMAREETGQIQKMLLDRVALHAFSIEFNHPFHHHPVRLEAPYPPDFQSAIEQLGSK